MSPPARAVRVIFSVAIALALVSFSPPEISLAQTIGPELPLPAKPRGHYQLNELGRAPHPDIPGPLRIPDSQIEPLKWSDLDGWADEDHAAAFTVFRASCKTVVASSRASKDTRPMSRALLPVCRRAVALEDTTADGARKFFEDNFVPTRITKLGDAAGFLTGYFEPIVQGSRFPTQIFKVPVYRRPRDLIPPSGAAKGGGFPNTGQSMRKTADGKLVPYYARGEIEDGVLDGEGLEICWIKDPVDLFYIQIQGSARIRLEDNTMLRVNYDAHNGYPYTAIGRILIERKEVPRDEMSMDRIRQWMATAPDGGKELRSHNKGFVFFRVAGLSDDNEANGAQGIPLTARRSIAVDDALHVYGTPFFIEANLAIDTPKQDTKFRRLMIAQDTGSAITGPARADLYFGAGDAAGKVAGRIRNPGKFTLLIPREIDPVAAGAAMPLPAARPDVEEIMAVRARARTHDANAMLPLNQPEAKSEEAKPEEKKAEQKKPSEAKPADTKPAAPAPAQKTSPSNTAPRSKERA